MPNSGPLSHTRIVVTRPTGTGRSWAHRICVLGGTPLLLPGSSLHARADTAAATRALDAALAGDIAIFTSPAAVRFARRLAPLVAHARLLAPGAGTLRALARAGATSARAPHRENSEGILALPALQAVQALRVALVGAAGGRGLLERELTGRGAQVTKVYVYTRQPARLDQRHIRALQRHARQPLYVLLSSTEALANILGTLPQAAHPLLLAGRAVVSSARIATAAQDAGFASVAIAGSAHLGDLLAAVARAVDAGCATNGSCRPASIAK